MGRPRTWSTAAILVVVCASRVWAQAPVSYQFSFPEREHHLLQVEATFAELPPGPLQLRMSRSSPGRYATHDFAKNVFEVRAADDTGRSLAVTRTDPHGWEVTDHSGSVRMTYKVFGDRLDGTYLSVDGTHAHINMPAAVMWARGLERRTIQVRFERPTGTSWKVATQLMPGTDSYTFSAPNLQYLMDSPTEFSDFSVRTFTVSDRSRTPVFRFVAHHTGTETELDALTRDVQSIVRETLRVFGEYPPYENNTYTFLADYLPWAGGDAMEHRNSTVLTSSTSIRAGRADLLDSIAHEFFHGWNVERIRPKSLEPFNLDDVNMSGELWLAEGFTNYYGPLVLKRAGLTNLRAFLLDLGGAIDAVVTGPGRALRTPIEMSQLAPFVDQAVANDRTNFDNTFISYYTWGSVIAMGLDLTLRDRTDGRVTLDDFMRALWERYGKPGTRVPGYVETPYTMNDVKEVLASLAGDAAFANEFFARFIEGRDVVDFDRLLKRAGIVIRPRAPGRGWAGDLRWQETPTGARILGDVPFDTPAYRAGLERDDVIVSVGNARVTSPADAERLIGARKPGDAVSVVYERRGQRVTTTLKLAEDPHRELVAMEEAGQTVTEEQRRFRDRWLGSAY